MDGEVIGFSIEGHTDKGVLAIKKNSKVPFLMKKLISSTIVSEKPFVVEIKLTDKLFRKSKSDPVRKLVIGSAENLSRAIDIEMIKYGCTDGLDYSLEVIKK